MRIPISEIKINPGRREVLSKRVSELAKSIAEVGFCMSSRVMRETIFHKPARHHFADRENMTEEEQQLLEEKEMSKIGG